MAAALGKVVKYLPQAISFGQQLGHLFGLGKARCNKVKHVLHARMMGGKVHIGHLMQTLPKAKKFVEGEVAHLVKPIADLFHVGEEHYNKIHDYLKSRGHVKMGGAWLPTWDQVISGVKTGAEVYKVVAPLVSSGKKKGGYNSAPNKPDGYSEESLARRNDQIVAERERKSANYNNFLRSGMSQQDAWNAAYGVGGGAWMPTWDQVISGVKTGAEVYKVVAPLVSSGKKKGGITLQEKLRKEKLLNDYFSPAAREKLTKKYGMHDGMEGGVCSMDYNPVMATNGRKYGNMCQLQEAGATPEHDSHEEMMVERRKARKVGGNAIWDANFCDSMKGKPSDPQWCKSNRYNRTGVWSGGAWLPTWDQVINGVKTGAEVYKIGAPLTASSNTTQGSPGYRSPLSSKGGRKRGPTRHGLAVKRVMEEHGMKLADASRYVKEHGLAHM